MLIVLCHRQGIFCCLFYWIYVDYHTIVVKLSRYVSVTFLKSIIISTIEQLLKYRDDWEDIKAIIQGEF